MRMNIIAMQTYSQGHDVVIVIHCALPIAEPLQRRYHSIVQKLVTRLHDHAELSTLLRLIGVTEISLTNQVRIVSHLAQFDTNIT